WRRRSCSWHPTTAATRPASISSPMAVSRRSERASQNATLRPSAMTRSWRRPKRALHVHRIDVAPLRMRGDRHFEQLFPQAVIAAHHGQRRRAWFGLQRFCQFCGQAARKNLEFRVFDGLAEHLCDLLMHRRTAVIAPLYDAAKFPQHIDLGPAERGCEFIRAADGLDQEPVL